ncbi:ROK family protein [Amycolatopsis saalfeldensis]|uniref:Sugar kinase of the NBD/HSP70 family, may contain an N-terminal HTH domain n=1 Tax=Amycolatopsis saalfeldensis TaxID=394193 RepID=A0A1H8YHF1_9PSEU|nr:ROK family protein [Amycolatopsis saalfeldensis]SEP51557.1 Sugar kinase of the NBD/HSP70 family, may contain an N-terminal HTH domain [Amycolatopsis saalfeldensis]
MPRSAPARAPITSPAAATVFTTVLTQGPVSRVDVARRTGLSSAAVTKAARPFIEAGYLEELASAGRTAPGAGRPASPLAIRPDREYFIGVKITGDDLIGVVTDLRAQIRVARHHALTSHEAPHVVAALTDLVGELLGSRAPDGATNFRDRAYCLGVAVSGDVDRDSGLVRYSPFLGWRDVPLAELLEDATGLATTLENDVKALTVAEQWFGEGVGASSFALVTVGTGIGSALVLDGRLVGGAHGVAGEVGHVPVAAMGPDSPRCHCGGTGCVEAIASTEAIVASARRVAADPALTMDDAVSRARAGDEPLRHVFATAGHAIGLGLGALANLFGPERIVVSGEGVAAYDLFEDQIRRTFAEQAFGSAVRCGLVIRPLPFEEWARGAAAVAVQSLFVSDRL